MYIYVTAKTQMKGKTRFTRLMLGITKAGFSEIVSDSLFLAIRLLFIPVLLAVTYTFMKQFI